MKVYIAGPMTGLPEFNYPAFEQARKDLAALGHEVLCPTDAEAENDTGEPQAWDWYMRRAVRMVSEADAIALLPGWKGSRGARVEYALGVALNLEVRPLEGWVTE